MAPVNARGWQYKINVYTCEGTQRAGKAGCGARMKTIDRDAGTTPFLTTCVACGQTSKSAFYKVPQDIVPTHEWYRPDRAEFDKLPAHVQEHVRMGGLVLREIGSLPTIKDLAPIYGKPEHEIMSRDNREALKNVYPIKPKAE